MFINILLPYKEKFSINKASSVSLTVANNLEFSKYKKQIRIFGHNVEDPMYKNNFIGIHNSWNFLKSKNQNLSYKMCELVNKENQKFQIIEIHNRPYLVNSIYLNLKNKKRLSLFLHNDPIEMKGSKTIEDRRNLLSKLERIYCVSEFIKKRFLIGITDHLNKVVVLHNGVVRRQKTMPKKQKQIIYVGRIVKEKGVDLFVDAIKEIYEDFKDWNFKIIGSPKLGINKLDNFSLKIKKDFESLGERAKMIGFINSKKLNKIMSDASVIVIPSVWNEPFGLVAAEAMSNGIAVISSSSGGLPEIVQDNGILINNINSKKIAKQLKKIILDTSLLKELQKKSWKNFSFDSKTISSKLDDHRQELFLKD